MYLDRCNKLTHSLMSHLSLSTISPYPNVIRKPFMMVRGLKLSSIGGGFSKLSDFREFLAEPLWSLDLVFLQNRKIKQLIKILCQLVITALIIENFSRFQGLGSMVATLVKCGNLFKFPFQEMTFIDHRVFTCKINILTTRFYFKAI